MSKLVVAALASACLTSIFGCVPAMAAAPAYGALPPSPARPAPLERLLAEAWASETTAYADLLAESASQPTAVYDIMARVVVLPGGDRLEAHSGLRERADDPRFVAQRMRGATPPALYDLEPRERLFHGVAALRLKPVYGEMFGRTGLLAHTYMLHGRPESNGCVVFRDYAAFLRAFREGRIRRLRVVPSAGDGVLIEIIRAARRVA